MCVSVCVCVFVTALRGRRGVSAPKNASKAHAKYICCVPKGVPGEFLGCARQCMQKCAKMRPKRAPNVPRNPSTKHAHTAHHCPKGNALEMLQTSAPNHAQAAPTHTYIAIGMHTTDFQNCASRSPEVWPRMRSTLTQATKNWKPNSQRAN